MSAESSAMQTGTAVYFPDGQDYVLGYWTGLVCSNDDGSDILYAIRCERCERVHVIDRQSLYPLPDMEEFVYEQYVVRQGRDRQQDSIGFRILGFLLLLLGLITFWCAAVVGLVYGPFWGTVGAFAWFGAWFFAVCCFEESYGKRGNY